MASAIDEVLRIHRAQLQGLVELRGVKKMRSIYEQARGELDSQLGELKRHGRGKTFQAQHLRVVLAQVNDAVHLFEKGLLDHLTKNGRIAGALSSRHLVQATKTLEAHFAGHAPVLALEQAAVMRRVYARTDPSLLNRFQSSVKLYGKPVIKKVRDNLALSMIKAETIDQAVDRVASATGVFAGERWRAERIVRTETVYAYGVVKQRSMEELHQAQMPDLLKRLVATHDDRTGEDSLKLDGQTVPVNQPFQWHTPKGVVAYMQPPNRCNDREIVIPWRPGWAPPPEQGGVDPTTSGLPVP